MLEQQIKENVGNVKEAASAMLEGIKNNKELEEVIGTSESIKKGSKIINITMAIVFGLVGIILTYLFPSLDLFGGDSKEYKQYYQRIAVLSSFARNDSDFEALSTSKLFRNPSVSDIELKQYQLEGEHLWITAHNDTNQYVYVKITAKGEGFGGVKNAVAYGVLPPKGTAKVRGDFDSLPWQIDANSIKVEKVNIFDMDKAIKNINKMKNNK